MAYSVLNGDQQVDKKATIKIYGLVVQYSFLQHCFISIQNLFGVIKHFHNNVKVYTIHAHYAHYKRLLLACKQNKKRFYMQ